MMMQQQLLDLTIDRDRPRFHVKIADFGLARMVGPANSIAVSKVRISVYNCCCMPACLLQSLSCQEVVPAASGPCKPRAGCQDDESQSVPDSARQCLSTQPHFCPDKLLCASLAAADHQPALVGARGASQQHGVAVGRRVQLCDRHVGAAHMAAAL